jgi:hypothetical protein
MEMSGMAESLVGWNQVIDCSISLASKSYSVALGVCYGGADFGSTRLTVPFMNCSGRILHAATRDRTSERISVVTT